jgi:hypothetical protein
MPEAVRRNVVELLPLVSGEKPRREQDDSVRQQRKPDERNARQRRPAIDEIADG